MDIRLRDLGQHKILEIYGDVDLYNVGELKKAIFDLIEKEEVKSLVIDLKAVPYMDSSGIGALVAGQKKMKLRGGKFALMHLQDDVFTMLKLATLDRFFTIYESETQLQGVA
ncbi:MAG: STAS domain-containing protein [Leptospiraceae bacterium]|nr:STAS domain-containing protein [Leptospiraceae bacterium]MDW8305905.1 STAS domain-containing protein [Leptospiraceae bacterium]